MTTKRRIRTGRASVAKGSKTAKSANRAEDSVCAVCGKSYPSHTMTWHVVDRLHDGYVTRERVGLCARDAEKVMAGERAHLRHVAHEGHKLPHVRHVHPDGHPDVHPPR